MLICWFSTTFLWSEKPVWNRISNASPTPLTSMDYTKVIFSTIRHWIMHDFLELSLKPYDNKYWFITIINNLKHLNGTSTHGLPWTVLRSGNFFWSRYRRDIWPKNISRFSWIVKYLHLSRDKWDKIHSI